MTKKVKILLSIIAAVIVVCGAVAVIISLTSWRNTFEIKYIDYVSDFDEDYDDDYTLYEVTNKSNKTVRDVYAIIEVDQAVDSLYHDFKYECRVSSVLHPGETVEFELKTERVKREAEKAGTELFHRKVDIIGFKWE